MKIQKFHQVLIACLDTEAGYDKDFAVKNGLNASTLSGYKSGRIMPSSSQFALLFRGIQNPSSKIKLLNSYLINSAPEGLEQTIAELLEETPLLRLDEIAENIEPQIIDLELNIALERLRALAGQKTDIRQLITIVGRSTYISSKRHKRSYMTL